MSFTQTAITVGLIMLGTILTRALPFWIFPPQRETPRFVRYLGEVLPAAVLGMLVVYCYKDVTLQSGQHGIPEFLAGALVLGLQFWKRNMFLSLLGGTGAYMLMLYLF